jgi:hypothetical protein
MTNQKNADGIVCKALVIAAGLGLAGFLYYLRVLGIPATGLLVALGMTLFVSAMTVAVAALILGSKAQ